MKSTRHTDLKILLGAAARLPNKEARDYFWRTTLDLSISSLEIALRLLTDAHQSKNCDALGELFHKISGTISFMGCETMTHHLDTLQTLCQKRDLSNAWLKFITIKPEIEQIIMELRHATDKLPTATCSGLTFKSDD